ncbi:MAG: Ribosomal RNA small subunit methyltransferase A [Acidimicrobiales bacterium]|nr:MAG: 16S rRNA (adenine(1518)-N(6)/adenine(1519)-N(6))-dimethyltransferase RsmA [Actinomycetota bacterium]MBV6507791.1 Ribosomal RNA small subunit methyltransferase A [Acidimicrobiales bacterium]RIK05949.1 MAG: 16S rRNA (adenine(1518)-N(6)/adenine(1519)-N(6))-dimethyltransferase [Acidobacteriota bacterium]
MLTKRDISALLHRYELSPSRALGQNFVADPNTVRRIARLARIGAGNRVVEIGAGLGSLTLALLETGASVTAVELDRHLLPALEEVLAGSSAQVVCADATELDWEELLGDGDWVMVANLPYNIATSLILDVLDEVPQVHRMLVMVQREVGERLVAEPGSRQFGIPSLKVGYWAEAAVVGRVGRAVFVPKPKVESALVEIRRRGAPAVAADPARLFDLVRAGFSQRRKMIRRSLAGLLSADDIVEAGVSPRARPEQLSLDEWAKLAEQAGDNV